MIAVDAAAELTALIDEMPESVKARRTEPADVGAAAVLLEEKGATLPAALRDIADSAGAIPLVQSATSGECAVATPAYEMAWLVEEVSHIDQHNRGGRQCQPDDDRLISVLRLHKKPRNPCRLRGFYGGRGKD